MNAPNQPESIGRYQILERVGKGGMGVLYRGFDPVLDREVAIKLMLTDFTDDTEQMRPRFYREAPGRLNVTAIGPREADDAARVAAEMVDEAFASVRPIVAGDRLRIQLMQAGLRRDIARLVRAQARADAEVAEDRRLRRADRWSTEFGRAQMIYRMDGGYLGASDRRTDGQAVGY